jgi:hypothetical protein
MDQLRWQFAGLRRKSRYLLGRRPIRDRLKKNGECSVVAVQCLPNSDPWVMYMESETRGRKRRPVLYRINIRLKQGVKCDE